MTSKTSLEGSFKIPDTSSGTDFKTEGLGSRRDFKMLNFFDMPHHKIVRTIERALKLGWQLSDQGNSTFFITANDSDPRKYWGAVWSKPEHYRIAFPNGLTDSLLISYPHFLFDEVEKDYASFRSRSRW